MIFAQRNSLAISQRHVDCYGQTMSSFPLPRAASVVTHTRPQPDHFCWSFRFWEPHRNGGPGSEGKGSAAITAKNMYDPIDGSYAGPNTRLGLGIVCEYSLARSLYAEFLKIFRELGDRTGAAWTLNHQGDAARMEGDATAARALYEEGLIAFRELGDRWGIASSLADLGNLACDQEAYARAHLMYSESIKLFQELEHKRGIARLLECFVSSAAAQSKAERALRLAGAASALRQAIGAPLPPSEQGKLEKDLKLARNLLENSAGATAWTEGWVTPVEKAIQDCVEI
jgi:tetratricopeptide (TPR) repeat protein